MKQIQNSEKNNLYLNLRIFQILMLLTMGDKHW